MIILFIICGILYLFMIYGVIYLYYTYRKDIEELEDRLLQEEKRTANNKNDIDYHYKLLQELIIKYYDEKKAKNKPSKEVLDMACKKGKGGRKK